MFDRESSPNLLRYTLDPGEQVDEFTFHMLQESPSNRIPVIGKEDGALLLPVSHCRSLTETLQNGADIREVIHSLLSGIRDARQHMIPVSELLLNIRFLYINEKTKEVMLLCLPTDHAPIYSQEPREVFRSIAAAAAYSGAPIREEVWDLLCYINSREYSLDGLVEFLNRPKKEEQKEEPSLRGKLQSFLTGDTRELPEVEAYSGPDDAYSIVLRATGQEFTLGKHSAVIGSDPAKADICLRCNPFADAEHAKILWERGAYYIEDLHSHGGVKRNSRKVKLWRPERLEPGDVLKIGEDELVFSCRNMPK